MRTGRFVAPGLTLIALFGIAAARAQPGASDRAPLDPKAISVRLLLGVEDDGETPWDGRVTVDHGEVLDVEGWRFREGDRLDGPSGWSAKSHTIRTAPAPKKKVAKKKADAGPGTSGGAVTPNGVVVTVKAPEDATLSVETKQGAFKVPLADLRDGSPRSFLDGQVEASRIPAAIPLADGPEQQDFPAAAVDAKGTSWVAYVHHAPRGTEVSEALTNPPRSFRDFIPKGGGDQVRLVRLANGSPGRPIAVTGPGLDVWRPSIAVDGQGGVVVAWSENKEGNWDLYSRRYDPAGEAWAEPRRLTTQADTDAEVVLAAAPDGKVWMAWQSWFNGQADVMLAPVDGASNPINVSQTPSNEWAPAIAIDRSGAVHVAFDSYQAGNYDVVLRTRAPDGALGRPVAVANSDRYEARPSLAADPSGRVWVAYEERTAQWGKDAENLIDGEGTSLYRSAAVRVRCVDGGRLLEAPDPLAGGSEDLQDRNSYPRLAVDRTGRVWLAFRHREEAVWGGNAVMVIGGVWLEYVTSLAGPKWSTPQVLPRSDGLLDNRPSLVVPADGPTLIVYNTDARLRHEVEFTSDLRRRFYTHSGTPAGVVDNDIQVAALVPTDPGATVEPATSGPATNPPPDAQHASHANEAADVARMRGYRLQADGKTYRLLRGEFHRHSEISQDGGSDGSLEDMWRYAIDAGHLDWIGNGDHDNGGGKEYTWWLIQKTTDLYHNAPAFNPMFTYERSVGYPGGHRNVMFPFRGVRTLPRLVDEDGVRLNVGPGGRDEDAAMLYNYLNELGGICASHTSGTGMGNDWRANDPKAEPFVEIFQGHRNSYEHLGAPRVARRQSEAIGGWKPLGMIWNALALNYRLAFQASSDHISTHISYGVAIAEDASREALFDAFRNRHVYGATDNILLDVRSGEHLMGDEFQADGPVNLRILAAGTGPIARVDIIKDFVYVYSTEPGTDRVSFTWTDEEKRPPGVSWYYVRILQEDGQIAWGSPMWVHTDGGGRR